MANLNKVLLMGNLTRDPELRYTPKGTAVGELALAVNRRVRDANDNWTEEATFVDVTVWGNNAENAQKYLHKGRAVFIEGRLQLDTWQDKQSGQNRSKLKVVAEILQFLPDGKGGASRGGASASGGGSQGGSDGGAKPEEGGQSSGTGQGGSAADPGDAPDDDGDDIPF